LRIPLYSPANEEGAKRAAAFWRDKMRLLRESVMAVAIGAAVLAAPAAADDRGGPHPWSWQGSYAGVHVGFGDMDGFFGGGQIGYNWQNGKLVYGVEADLALSSMEESLCVGGLGCVSASVDWLATVRGRAGYLIDPSILVYGTAGFGIVSWSLDANVVGFPGLHADGTETDLVLGLGVEAKINETMTGRLEVLTSDELEGEVFRAALNFKLGK
jgi:opacity protein-like surface antigen